MRCSFKVYAEALADEHLRRIVRKFSDPTIEETDFLTTETDPYRSLIVRCRMTTEQLRESGAWIVWAAAKLQGRAAITPWEEGVWMVEFSWTRNLDPPEVQGIAGRELRTCPGSSQTFSFRTVERTP